MPSSPRRPRRGRRPSSGARPRVSPVPPVQPPGGRRTARRARACPPTERTPEPASRRRACRPHPASPRTGARHRRDRPPPPRPARTPRAGRASVSRRGPADAAPDGVPQHHPAAGGVAEDAESRRVAAGTGRFRGARDPAAGAVAMHSCTTTIARSCSGRAPSCSATTIDSALHARPPRPQGPGSSPWPARLYNSDVNFFLLLTSYFLLSTCDHPDPRRRSAPRGLSQAERSGASATARTVPHRVCGLDLAITCGRALTNSPIQVDAAAQCNSGQCPGSLFEQDAMLGRE